MPAAAGCAPVATRTARSTAATVLSRTRLLMDRRYLGAVTQTSQGDRSEIASHGQCLAGAVREGPTRKPEHWARPSPASWYCDRHRRADERADRPAQHAEDP